MQPSAKIFLSPISHESQDHWAGSPAWSKYLRENEVYEGGNEDLFITEAGKAELTEAFPQLHVTWPKEVR